MVMVVRCGGVSAVEVTRVASVGGDDDDVVGYGGGGGVRRLKMVADVRRWQRGWRPMEMVVRVAVCRLKMGADGGGRWLEFGRSGVEKWEESVYGG
ncbi:hypothetical protein Tco_0815589 [Tanacetum coccineum]